MIEHAYLIALIPLAASLIMMFGAREDPHSPAPWIGIGAMAICLGLSLSILDAVARGSVPVPYEHNWQWFSFAASLGGKPFLFDVPIGVLIDGPAALMLVVVTLVSLMVQLYSIAYMHEDTRYNRYFAFVSFFTASMLGLVISSNILVGFMSWELMGLSSYLLIGFWFEKDGPTHAQKKAFMTTKLGDCGLYLALLFIFAKVGSFQISQIHRFINQGYMTPAVAAVIALGILFGAMGKSAQFPLFIWLPDAMEGPTPVSALIHAATMVAAGIFVVARLYFVFLAAPDVMLAAAWIGCLTAFLAASMALVSYDIKRVLAFSTVSQLGFMMCAPGARGYTAGLFHLTTHAFFYALFFLGAASVIHAVHTNDLPLMRAPSNKSPSTFLTMLTALAAIAGLPLTSGYFSKDMILANIYDANRTIFWIMLFTALMTAFYMSRLFILTFLGDDRDHEKHHHAHESPFLMTGPLVLLAFLALVSGYMLNRNGLVYNLLPKPAITTAQASTAAAETAPADAHAAAAEHAQRGEDERHEGRLPHWLHFALPFLVLGSMSLAFVIYKGPKYPIADALKESLALAFTLLDRRWFLDDAFNLLVVFCDKVAATAYWIDTNIVDRIFVDSWGLLMRLVCEISNLVDAIVVDRTVDGFGSLSLDLGVGLRGLVKDGQVQEYLMYVAIAFSLATTLILTR